MKMVDRKDIIAKLKDNNYKYTEYSLGIKVHMNQSQYIDISRGQEGDLYVDLYNGEKIDPRSLEILEDHGRIRFESLVKVLDIARKNLVKY